MPRENSPVRAEALFRLAEQEFQGARQIDAQEETPGRTEDFTLVKVRD